MGQEILPSDQAVHSDFLIHWTGKDIDGGPAWYDGGRRSTTSEEQTERYLRRLKNTLRYGLWMTEENAATFFVGGTSLNVPAVPQVCFTELKLSESRRHARNYGRLGIGVKRPFLFHRFGRPLTYFGFSHDRHKDKLLEAFASSGGDQRFLNFFKPMNEDYHRLGYELYSESEWRMIKFDELLEDGKLVNPRDSTNAAAHAYFNSLDPTERAKLKYLVPLDGWLAMIIYPSLDVKNRARWDSDGVRGEIERIKLRADDPGNEEEGLKDPVRGNWPVEVDLDACAHF